MLAAGCWLIAGIVPVPVHLSPPPPEAVRAAVDAAVRRRGVQRELPSADLARPPDPTERRSGYDGVPRSSVDASYGPSRGAIAVGRVLLYGALGVLGIVVLVGVASAIQRRRAARTAAPHIPATTSAARAPPPFLDDAGALAAAGRFDAAVHALLMRALADLRVDGQRVPDPWTSREAVDGANVPRAGREALRWLIEAVEWSHFGGRPVDAGDYARACDAFARFASAGSVSAS